ncbi:MATE family efflux transporter [Roseobacter ponti]|uniref:MATE family efflux transporter n=1 Tax=Roseobacter ponti TaxID=1891787 RepID=A0A858ST67_9RHOB|nr:MATE family efflux transporter [Roseobacter ponti]QJF50066.1 MATE family efflux transporter [Roseobacter ponti]
MSDARAKFLTGSLFRHVTVMSLTSSVGLLAIFAVDFIDMIFIAMLGKAELAAAVGYAATILFFTTSFGIGLAIAAGALVARALGAGDAALAAERRTHSLLYGVLLSLGFAALTWVFLPQLVSLLGATGEVAELAVGYLRIVVPSLPLLVIGMMAGAILRAHGDARRSMMATIWGGVTNAVLDPVLIFGLGLDLTGAALASVAARVVIAGTAMVPIMRHYGGVGRPTAAGMLRDLVPLAAIGLPAILTQLATPAGQAIVTRAMAVYGEAAVAGMAITGRLSMLSFAVIFALSGAVGPILGQNFGARDFERVRAGFRAALLFTGIVVVTVSALLFVLRAPIAGLFAAQGITRELVYLFCGPLSLLFFFNGVLFVANAGFNNLGHPFWSTFLNWGRNTVGMLPLVWLGSATLGASGVLIGQAAAGVIFGLLAWGLARRVMQTPDEVPEGMASEYSEIGRQGRLMALLHLRR